VGVTVLRTNPEEKEECLAGILCNAGLVFDFALAATGAMNRLNFFDGGTLKGNHWVGKPCFLIVSGKHPKPIDCQYELVD
jgi:hypothetical protein